jgi:hypothetical protein
LVSSSSSPAASLSVNHLSVFIYVGRLLNRLAGLFPGYALALYLHRFLENSLAPAYAKRTLGISAWSQIIVGGSNFGELLGALSVFLLSDYVTTPVSECRFDRHGSGDSKFLPQIPWLRIDALALNIVWILPYFSTIAKQDVSWAWRAAGTFIPISYGWAAGDVSLAAYIQSALSAGDYGELRPVYANVHPPMISCSLQVRRRLRPWSRDGLPLLLLHHPERDTEFRSRGCHGP